MYRVKEYFKMYINQMFNQMDYYSLLRKVIKVTVNKNNLLNFIM